MGRPSAVGGDLGAVPVGQFQAAERLLQGLAEDEHQPIRRLGEHLAGTGRARHRLPCADTRQPATAGRHSAARVSARVAPAMRRRRALLMSRLTPCQRHAEGDQSRDEAGPPTTRAIVAVVLAAAPDSASRTMSPAGGKATGNWPEV